MTVEGRVQENDHIIKILKRTAVEKVSKTIRRADFVALGQKGTLSTVVQDEMLKCWHEIS